MQEAYVTLPSYCCWLILGSIPLHGQGPLISPGGIVNAASLMPVDRTPHGIAPGSIATIFGQNLAPSPTQAQSYPLPTSLNGTTVSVNGIAVPLFYVSPEQINFQVPSYLSTRTSKGYPTATVEVSTGAGKAAASMDLWYVGFGFFTLDGSGCGRGAVLNLNPDGTTSVNSPFNSVSPGSYLILFGTGLGPVDRPPSDGSAAPLNPLSPSQLLHTFSGSSGLISGVNFVGRAPGMAGVDQVNAMISVKAEEGCAVPLSYADTTVPVSIHSGGGQCVDPPPSSVGQMLLKRSVVLNAPAAPETDSFIASFSGSPYLKLASPPVQSSGQLAAQASAVCPAPGYTVLDAGAITLAGPAGLRAQAQLSGLRFNTGYQLALPAGSVQAGTYQISSPGGKDAGGFQATMDVPAGIQITSNFPQGTVITNSGTRDLKPLTVTWTGGGPGQLVTLKMIEHRAGDGDETHTLQVPATAQSASFGPACTGPLSNPYCKLFSGGATDAELVVELGPDPAALPTFSAHGLTLGGLMGWVYEYRFTGLSIP
jgi:uncharacterized protein (TIGR03437 family)